MNYTLPTFMLPVILLLGCSSSPTSERYSINNDLAPQAPISVDHIENAHPKYEPYSLSGNTDYTLRGVHYTIIKNTKGFKERGKASWYGKKFHGHLTSNGEVYDMYSMSAAHKTLPIPSYVKATNLDNNKSVIVRVNDRGPFHENRIIDLSYAAAYKLGITQTGTANIEIEVITVEKDVHELSALAKPQYMIQVASFPSNDKATNIATDLGQKFAVGSFIETQNNNHRILIGPLNDYDKTQETLEKIKLLGYNTAFVKKYTIPQQD